MAHVLKLETHRAFTPENLRMQHAQWPVVGQKLAARWHVDLGRDALGPVPWTECVLHRALPTQ